MFLLNFRRPTWQRAGIALLLAFLATTIVKPYFLPFVTVGQLLTRMAVIATVMLPALVVAGNLQFRNMSQDRARYLVPLGGAFIELVIAGLIQGRSLVEMFTEQGRFLGILILAAAGISIGVIAAMLAAHRERSASDESTDLATGLEELSQRLGLPTRNTCVGLRPASAGPYGYFLSKTRSIFSPTKNIPASCWRFPKS